MKTSIYCSATVCTFSHKLPGLMSAKPFFVLHASPLLCMLFCHPIIFSEIKHHTLAFLMTCLPFLSDKYPLLTTFSDWRPKKEIHCKCFGDRNAQIKTIVYFFKSLDKIHCTICIQTSFMLGRHLCAHC